MAILSCIYITNFNDFKVLFLFLIKSADGEKEDQFNGSPPRPQPRGPRTPPGPPPPDDDEDDPMPLPGRNNNIFSSLD